MMNYLLSQTKRATSAIEPTRDWGVHSSIVVFRFYIRLPLLGVHSSIFDFMYVCHYCNAVSSAYPYC
jgi:hypothetical protein